jgi:hypothetical protein
LCSYATAAAEAPFSATAAPRSLHRLLRENGEKREKREEGSEENSESKVSEIAHLFSTCRRTIVRCRCAKCSLTKLPA